MIVLLDQTALQLRDAFETHGATNKIRSLSCYETNDGLKFAVVMHQGLGTEQYLLIDIDESWVHEFVETWAPAMGLEPVILTATGPSPIRYTLVLEARQNPRVLTVKTRVSIAQLTEEDGVLAQLDAQNGNIVWIDRFDAGSVEPTDCVCCIFDPSPAQRQAWNVSFSLHNGTTDIGTDCESVRLQWGRPEAIFPKANPDGSLSVLTWWRDDVYQPMHLDPAQFRPGVWGGGPLYHAELGVRVQEALDAGWVPLTIMSAGSGSGLRWGTVCSTSSQNRPLRRAFRISDTVEPFVAFNKLRDWRPALVDDDGSRAASVNRAAVREDVGGRASRPRRPPRQRAPLEMQPLMLQPSPGGRADLPGAHGARQAGGIGWPFGASLHEEHVADLDTPGGLYVLTDIDRVIFDVMRRNGARGCQLAIARNGQLKFAKSYVWAEEGYPDVLNTHLLRIGSCTKPLTALCIMKQFGPESGHPTGFETPLTVLLEIPNDSPKFPELDAMSLQHLVRHRTSWISGESFLPNNISSELAKPTLGAGDLRNYLAITSDPLVDPDVPVGSLSSYNNINYGVLGEIVSRNIGMGSAFNDYGRALRLLLDLPLDGSRGHLAAPSWAEAISTSEANVHGRSPGPLYNAAGEPATWLYGGDGGLIAGAGEVVMSAVELCRIFCGINPLSPRALLNDSEFQELLQGYTFDVPDSLPASAGFDAQWFGFGGAAQFFTWRGGEVGLVPFFEFTGEVTGGKCYFRHRQGYADSLTYVIAFTSDCYFDGSPVDNVIAAHERDFGWPPGDAF